MAEAGRRSPADPGQPKPQGVEIVRSSAHDLAALAVGAAFLLLYALTSAPGLLFADSAEFQTVALAGGIPHATGYPLWIALVRAFTWLPLGDPEFRVTLFSGVCGAAALGLLVRRLGEMGVGVAAAVAAACFLGVTFSFWRVSVRAEVYTLTALLALMALGAMLRGRSLRAGFLLGLVMTVHLAFAPVIALAGLVLAWREWRAAPGEWYRLPRLLGVFVLGLTPYLLLVVLDNAGVRANYLDQVREVVAMTGAQGPPIESSWDGVRWLVTGRNVYPPMESSFHPRSIAAMLVNCVALLFLFELGPLAFPLLLAGLVRHARRARARAALLAAAFAASLGFTAWVQIGPMLHLFMLPAILIGAILVADGIDGVIRWVAGARRVPARAVLAALVLWAALALPPALLRVHAQAHPIGERGWQVLEEDPALKAGFIPGMQHEHGPEAWTRAALEVFPQNALVMASWTHYTPLRHLQILEGRRPDLTLWQISVPTIAPRIRQWWSASDSARAPVVITTGEPRYAPWLVGADSLPLPGGRYAYVVSNATAESLLTAATLSQPR